MPMMAAIRPAKIPEFCPLDRPDPAIKHSSHQAASPAFLRLKSSDRLHGIAISTGF